MIDNNEDVIDSRDVIARIEQLSAIHCAGPVPEGVLDDEDYECDQDSLFAEERALVALAAEAEAYSEDWTYGATLVRDSYFVEYAQQLAEDIGVYPRGENIISWPFTYIDWDAAAEALKQDFTAVDFAGVTYWVR